MFRGVKEGQWSADHIARHDVTLDEVREAILERPHWQEKGKNDTTPICGRAHAGRHSFVVAVDDGGEAFVVDRAGREPR
ncbi:hypothetical protein [Actinosynnema sp.]|uniref:hypothetical protein n=1 Tax=Actinosynnema sp. TaxID=1872144 RepID=UPI003F85647C